MLRVSICIPTVRRLGCLREALDSVSAQTYGNFEVLVSDNSGNNNYNKAVAELVRSFPLCNIRLFHQSEMLNLVANANFLIENAEGDLWIYLPDDDLLEKDCLEKFVSQFIAHPELDLVVSDHWMVDVDGKLNIEETEKVATTYGRRGFNQGPINPDDLFGLALTQFFHLQSMMFRSELIRKLRFDEACLLFPDFALQLSIASVKPFVNAYYLPNRLARYRVHSGQDRYEVDPSEFMQQLIRFLENCDRIPDRALRKYRRTLGAKYRALAKYRILRGEWRLALNDLRRSVWLHPLSGKTWLLLVLSWVPARILKRLGVA